MKFRTTLLQGSKTAVGIVVPAEVVAALDAGKKPPVKVTIKGYTYRSTVAVMGGKFMVGVSAEHRAAAGVAGGETHDVQIDLDTEPRTVEVPPDFLKALKAKPAVLRAYEALSPSRKKEAVRQVESAKAAETRARRIAKIVDDLG